MKSFASRARHKFVALILRIFIRCSGKVEMVRVGTTYGGWWVPSNVLNSESICYLAGAGEDISFDLGLIELFGCSVLCLDPTPRSIAFVESQTVPERFQFLPLGVGGSNRDAKFFAPADPRHVSHSVVNLQRTDDYFVARLRTIRSLMVELGHDEVALLKLDIEGAEYEVLDSLIADGISPQVLLVEFDDSRTVLRTLRAVRELRQLGYVVRCIEGFNVSMCLGSVSHSTRVADNANGSL